MLDRVRGVQGTQPGEAVCCRLGFARWRALRTRRAGRVPHRPNWRCSRSQGAPAGAAVRTPLTARSIPDPGPASPGPRPRQRPGQKPLPTKAPPGKPGSQTANELAYWFATGRFRPCHACLPTRLKRMQHPNPLTQTQGPQCSRAGLRPEIRARSVLAALRSACGLWFHPCAPL